MNLATHIKKLITTIENNNFLIKISNVIINISSSLLFIALILFSPIGWVYLWFAWWKKEIPMYLILKSGIKGEFYLGD